MSEDVDKPPPDLQVSTTIGCSTSTESPKNTLNSISTSHPSPDEESNRNDREENIVDNPKGKIYVASNDSLQDFSSIRIVCLVSTQVKNHKTRVDAIRSTWGRKCKAIVFLTNSTEDLSDDIIADTNGPNTYSLLWHKTKVGFSDVWKKYKNDADWFLKTDDDTFVIMENLQKMLHEKNVGPDDPTWFGVHLVHFRKQEFMSGSGYILSRESTRRFVDIALKFTDQQLCRSKAIHGAEDLEMSRCLNSTGVKPGDSRDEYLRPRMFCLNAETVVKPTMPHQSFWFFNSLKYPQYFGHPGCCSDRPITFHYVKHNDIYLYNYLMYGAHVSGENNKYRAPPDPKTLVQNMNINWTQVWSLE